MKLAKSYQMKSIDRYAIEEIGIPGIILMENAANAVTQVVKARPESQRGVAILCGAGNNGGDGFAIARQLNASDLRVFIYVVGKESSMPDDAEINYRIDDRLGLHISFVNDDNLEELTVRLKHCGVVVDAVFGTGLSRDIDSFCGRVFEAVNMSGAYVVSVDIPSGVMGDTGRLCRRCIRANETVSFQLPKVGNIMYPGAEYNGQLTVRDIGMPDEAVESQQIVCEVTELSDVKRVIGRRRPDTHKGIYGRIGILSGSKGMAGASVLNSMAALRCGSGLVRVYVPEVIYSVVETSVTEAMVYGFDTAAGKYEEAIDGLLSFADIVATGSGCTNIDNYDEILKLLIKNSEKPVIIDAEGINSIARSPELLMDRKSPAIVLTPHCGEMAKLTNKNVSDVAAYALDIAMDYAVRMNVYLVLKGARTVTATPDGRAYVNTTGNPGMATAGSGDVLTGMIASFMGQCGDVDSAIKAAVYLHGLAGDVGSSRLGEYSLTAGDVVEAIPDAFKIITGE